MEKVSKTKIVATIGPSCWDDHILEGMLDAGVSMARINASFADFDELRRVSTQIRKISPRVAIMIDLKGYKIRITDLVKEIIVENEVGICSQEYTHPDAIKITYPNLHLQLPLGTDIFLDDGNIQLKVKDIKDTLVICSVIQSGILKPNKTVNIPSINLEFPSLTEKDKNDVLFALQNNFDYISASFVRKKEDILAIKELIIDSNIKIIAKIENQEGLDHIDEILEVSDAIMIARGDMGVEIPYERIPVIQKQLIYKCRSVGKPVIVATQMLESMRENKRPTRAEVSDVANAVMDGADALMLSAETSTGKYPLEAVSAMRRISLESESVMQQSTMHTHTDAGVEVDEICRNTCDIVENIDIKGIIVISNTGKTVRSLARHRPNTKIWEISNFIHRIRQDSILFGTKGYFTENIPTDRDECTKKAIEVIYANGELDLNDKIAIISGSSIKHNTQDATLEIVTVRDVLTR